MDYDGVLRCLNNKDDWEQTPDSLHYFCKIDLQLRLENADFNGTAYFPSGFLSGKDIEGKTSVEFVYKLIYNNTYMKKYKFAKFHGDVPVLPVPFSGSKSISCDHANVARIVDCHYGDVENYLELYDIR